jgi:uncharacterized protein involved in exopolysaccharide biosynthesis
MKAGAYLASNFPAMRLRRQWYILLPLTLSALGGVLGYHAVPMRYKSEALLQVVSPATAAEPAKGLSDSRVAAIEAQIFSDSRLQQLIDDFGLYPPRDNLASPKDTVETMRSNIAVTARGADASFSVAYTGGDPETVQKVTQRLAALCVEADPLDRESLAETTNQVLDSQLQHAKDSLIEQERKLEDYQRKHRGVQPSSELQSTLQVLQATEKQLRATRESMSRARARRQTLEQQIAQADGQTAAVAEPSLDGAAPGSGRPVQPGTQDGAPSVYSDASGAHEPVPLSRHALRLELQAVNAQLETSRAQQALLQKRMADTRTKVETLRVRELELQTLMRHRATLEDTYSTLLGKRAGARSSRGLAETQGRTAFRIQRPASRPERPHNEPKRLAAMLAGTVFGFGSGIVVLGLLGRRGSTFQDADDVVRLLSLPVLGLIPLVHSRVDDSGHVGPDS